MNYVSRRFSASASASVTSDHNHDSDSATRTDQSIDVRLDRMKASLSHALG